MGRQPKKRINVNEFRPLFDTSDDNELIPSRKLVALLEHLKIIHKTGQKII